MFKRCEIGGKIFLHHFITPGAAKVEDVIGILGKEFEIIVQGAGDEFPNDLRIAPTPLSVEVGITHHVEVLFLCEICRAIRNFGERFGRALLGIETSAEREGDHASY